MMSEEQKKLMWSTATQLAKHPENIKHVYEVLETIWNTAYLAGANAGLKSGTKAIEQIRKAQ